MHFPENDKVFEGSIPKLYEEFMVPMIFEPYALDIATRLAKRLPSSVLEIAAGTGVATRYICKTLPEAVRIVATDLNQPMLDLAADIGTSREVEWRQANAMELPFADGEFDSVVCQFGFMFFPDKVRAFSEARRVLKPGGAFIFNTWDRLEENEFPHTVQIALEGLFPHDPPKFMERTPHGYFDLEKILDDLRKGGFDSNPEVETVTMMSKARSARFPAMAFCQGTPLRGEIEARGKERLGEITDIAASAIAERFGDGEVEGKIQGYVISIY